MEENNVQNYMLYLQKKICAISILYRSNTKCLNKPEYHSNLKKWGNTFCTKIERYIVQKNIKVQNTVQFSSVAQSHLTLCDPMDCSMPGFPVHHQLLEFTQTHVHWVGDAIQPSHPRSSPSSAFNISQHQGFFRWVSSSHQVAKVLEFQLQHQSFQWIFRTDFL